MRPAAGVADFENSKWLHEFVQKGTKMENFICEACLQGFPITARCNEDGVLQCASCYNNGTWEWEGGSLFYPEGVVIFNNSDKHCDHRFYVPLGVFADDDEEGTPEEHKLLADFCDMMCDYLNKHSRGCHHE